MATPEQISVPTWAPHSWNISTVTNLGKIVAVAVCANCGRIRAEPVVHVPSLRLPRLDLTGECR
jgi:hypothetical protein